MNTEPIPSDTPVSGTPASGPASSGPAALVEVVLDALRAVAPDLDGVDVSPGADLQNDIGLDSMDSLNLVAAIKERTGVEIPDRETSRLRSVDAIAAWLVEHLASS